jgi:hypothetical protein
MFRLNSSARSAIRCLRTKRQIAMALSRSSIPEIASARSSRSSVIDICSSATSMPTLSPGERVSLRTLFSMALSIALAK